MSDRVFLDANILVSTAWRPGSGLGVLWTLPDTQLLTSAFDEFTSREASIREVIFCCFSPSDLSVYQSVLK